MATYIAKAAMMSGLVSVDTATWSDEEAIKRGYVVLNNHTDSFTIPAVVSVTTLRNVYGYVFNPETFDLDLHCFQPGSADSGEEAKAEEVFTVERADSTVEKYMRVHIDEEEWVAHLKLCPELRMSVCVDENNHYMLEMEDDNGDDMQVEVIVARPVKGTNVPMSKYDVDYLLVSGTNSEGKRVQRKIYQSDL